MKIAAIPTKYVGIQFRSRLEARWFAFFDLLKWSPQYEPFDLDGWIPDIMLPAVRPNRGSTPTLVEVKPILDMTDVRVVETQTKIDRAAANHQCLLVGVSPWGRKLGWARGGILPEYPDYLPWELVDLAGEHPGPSENEWYGIRHPWPSDLMWDDCEGGGDPRLVSSERIQQLWAEAGKAARRGHLGHWLSTPVFLVSFGLSFLFFVRLFVAGSIPTTVHSVINCIMP